MDHFTFYHEGNPGRTSKNLRVCLKTGKGLRQAILAVGEAQPSAHPRGGL